MKKCVFAGTFDPPTTGHKRVIEDCLKIFDEVVVAVMVNEGAVVDLLEKENTPFYVRGIRNTVDFEYENANFFANKKLKKDIVTVYLPAEQESLQISSTLVKNSVKFKKDFSDYVPSEILQDILTLLEKKDV